VAQVFKGSLLDSKTKEKKSVAIKLIHPHVEKMIKTDMELLWIFASFIDSFPSLEILGTDEVLTVHVCLCLCVRMSVSVFYALVCVRVCVCVLYFT
jgi:hypothetical protein